MVENMSHKCVVDASYILAFLLPDEKTKHVENIFLQHKNHTLHFVSHPLLRYEVIGGLWSAVHRKRIDEKTAVLLAGHFLAMDIVYQEVSYDDVLKLALETGLTTYDAGYLWLSRSNNFLLLTLDKELLKLKI
jgi:predicted nucleic acid-binding protein